MDIQINRALLSNHLWRTHPMIRYINVPDEDKKKWNSKTGFGKNSDFFCFSDLHHIVTVSYDDETEAAYNSLIKETKKPAAYEDDDDDEIEAAYSYDYETEAAYNSLDGKKGQLIPGKTKQWKNPKRIISGPLSSALNFPQRQSNDKQEIAKFKTSQKLLNDRVKTCAIECQKAEKSKNTTPEEMAIFKAAGNEFYIYISKMESEDKDEMEYHTDIAAENTAYNFTLRQLADARDDPNALIICYNEQPPDNQELPSKKGNGHTAHAKAMIIFKNGCGVLISHSFPRYPMNNSKQIATK
uniref:Uncharacterized protein n=1 Tax=Panagrolaimus davidi TaxID=227884 RepID=A0A914R9Q9_9BILA